MVRARAWVFRYPDGSPGFSVESSMRFLGLVKGGASCWNSPQKKALRSGKTEGIFTKASRSVHPSFSNFKP